MQIALSFADYKWLHRKLLMQASLRSGFEKRKAALLAGRKLARDTDMSNVCSFVQHHDALRAREDAEAAAAAARKQAAVEQVRI